MTTLLAYESVPRNAAFLARLGEVKLQEVRSLMQLKKAMERDTADIVAIEITEPQNLPTVARLIRQLKRDRKRVAVIAMPVVWVASQNQWLIQAGADLVFETALDREVVRRMFRRLVDRRQESQTPRQLGPSFQSQVVDSLPWKRFSS